MRMRFIYESKLLLALPSPPAVFTIKSMLLLSEHQFQSNDERIFDLYNILNIAPPTSLVIPKLIFRNLLLWEGDDRYPFK